ncbi:hypothetical protein ABZS29_02035 [Kribbella sp. NPDC005582]|uniref:hypothetical protein n=1 Tax=Kribbella sp. NPDC005582 TaxID=3156893 RepID=UPI0033BD27EF
MHDDKTATDDRVTTLFHDTTAEVEVDVAALVRGGISRGRAKHRLHTAGTAFAAAVGVAGIVGVAVTVPGLGSGGSGVAPAGASVPATSTTARPSTSTTAKPTHPKNNPTGKPTNVPPPATADIPVRAADLPGLFAQIYPGKITQAEKRTGRIIDDGKQNQVAHFLWKGYLTSVIFSAYRGTPAEHCEEIRQDARLAGRPPLTCAERPDGTFLLSAFGREPAVDGGGSGTEAILVTKDHYVIEILSYTYARKGGPNLSSQAPLSEAQLRQAVTSKVWF